MKYIFESDMEKGQCYMCPMCKEREIGYMCAIDDCFVTAIEDPSECPLQESNEVVWHPFPKEKPNEDGDYLVTIQWNIPKGEPYRVVGNASWMGFGWDMSDTEILAWSELPRPYEEVSDDK